jgi:cytochrome c553
MLLFSEDKRKLEDPAQDDLKKKMLKAMDDRQIDEVAAYYSTLK